MKIVVTGAAGFIGSHTAQALKAQGADVIGIDNYNDYYTPKQKRTNAKELQEQHIPIHELDIRSEETTKLIKEYQPDTIIHLAAMAGVRSSLEKPLTYLNVNVDGTQNILEAAKHANAHVILASSSSIYGKRHDAPFKETDRTDKQISPYATSKKAAELLCQTHTHNTKLPTTCLRFFTVYGERGRPDMAPYKFMKWILEETPITRYGDGTSQRDYTYVGDIVQGIIAATHNPNGFEIYNLGNNQPTSLNTFIATIEEITNKKATIKQQPVPTGDVPLTCADITKAQAQLNYQPKTSLKEGLTKQYVWYKKHANS